MANFKKRYSHDFMETDFIQSPHTSVVFRDGKSISSPLPPFRFNVHSLTCTFLTLLRPFNLNYEIIQSVINICMPVLHHGDDQQDRNVLRSKWCAMKEEDPRLDYFFMYPPDVLFVGKHNFYSPESNYFKKKNYWPCALMRGRIAS